MTRNSIRILVQAHGGIQAAIDAITPLTTDPRPMYNDVREWNLSYVRKLKALLLRGKS